MKKTALGAALLCATSLAPAIAADMDKLPIIYPPVINQPVVYHDKVQAVSSGWYLRGDVGFAFHKMRGISYYVSSGDQKTFDTYKLKSSFSAGAGVGYRINQRLRTDFTIDHIFRSSFEGSTIGSCGVSVTSDDCTSTDSASFRAWSLMANSYVDLFTYGRVTAYAGAGLGVSYVNWDDLNNTSCLTATPTTCDPTYAHAGGHGWRATAALMAGATVQINCAWASDIHYRYRYIAGGRMFGYAAGGGPGTHEAIHSHEARAGLRYSFGGCHQPPIYEPPVEPPVYK